MSAVLARLNRAISAHPNERCKRLCASLFVTGMVLVAGGQTKINKNPAVFSFPGSSKQAPSASGQLLATYKEISKTKNNTFQYLFYITNRSGNQFEEHAFARGVEGAWSPHSEQIYLNDFMGSTEIDCLVWKQGDHRLSSLTQILLYDPDSGPIEAGGAKPPETPQNARFELTCDEWTAEDKISVSLVGSTWSGGQFKYKLIFDPKSEKFSLNWK